MTSDTNPNTTISKLGSEMYSQTQLSNCRYGREWRAPFALIFGRLLAMSCTRESSQPVDRVFGTRLLSCEAPHVARSHLVVIGANRGGVLAQSEWV